MAKGIEEEVLVASRRRCCLCFGLHGDAARKRHGQVAHVDRNPANNSADNLAFLCLDHHSEYDSRSRQSKGLTPGEARVYRKALYDHLRSVLWAGNLADQAQQDALAFHVASHRFKSVLLAVAEAPATVAEINAAVPPGDLEWTQTIVSAALQDGWLECAATAPERFALTGRARDMLHALPQIPDEEKLKAWREVWDPE